MGGYRTTWRDFAGWRPWLAASLAVIGFWIFLWTAQFLGEIAGVAQP